MVASMVLSSRFIRSGLKAVSALSVMLASTSLLSAQDMLPDQALPAETSLSQSVFHACEPKRGCELWITDGTRSGTRVLRDIVRGTVGSNPQNLTALGDGRVVFGANRGRTNFDYQPWITDGTREGTRQIRRTSTRSIEMPPYEFTPLGDGRAVFVARGDGGANSQLTLWVTGGDRASTRPLIPLEHWPGLFIPLGNGLVLFRYQDASGVEMWVTDGTRRGTKLLRDINPGEASSSPNAGAALGDGRAVFNAADGVHGRELWVTHGTRRGTRMVKDLWPGSTGSDPQMFTPISGNRAMFTAQAQGSRRIGVTDGTRRGTRMLSHALNPTTMAHLGDGRVIFAAYVNSSLGVQLHVTDGTDEGTRMIRELPVPRAGYRQFVPLGDGRMLFWYAHEEPYELWVTDGTRRGTRRVGDAGALHISGLVELWSLMDGRAVFSRQDHRGAEPWITDGTRSGTRLLRDINRGGASSHSSARWFTPLQPVTGMRGVEVAATETEAD